MEVNENEMSLPIVIDLTYSDNDDESYNSDDTSISIDEESYNSDDASISIDNDNESCISIDNNNDGESCNSDKTSTSIDNDDDDESYRRAVYR